MYFLPQEILLDISDYSAIDTTHEANPFITQDALIQRIKYHMPKFPHDTASNHDNFTMEKWQRIIEVKKFLKQNVKTLGSRWYYYLEALKSNNSFGRIFIKFNGCLFYHENNLDTRDPGSAEDLVQDIYEALGMDAQIIPRVKSNGNTVLTLDLDIDTLIEYKIENLKHDLYNPCAIENEIFYETGEHDTLLAEYNLILTTPSTLEQCLVEAVAKSKQIIRARSLKLYPSFRYWCSFSQCNVYMSMSSMYVTLNLDVRTGHDEQQVDEEFRRLITCDDRFTLGEKSHYKELCCKNLETIAQVKQEIAYLFKAFQSLKYNHAF